MKTSFFFQRCRMVLQSRIDAREVDRLRFVKALFIAPDSLAQAGALVRQILPFLRGTLSSCASLFPLSSDLCRLQYTALSVFESLFRLHFVYNAFLEMSLGDFLVRQTVRLTFPS